MDELQELIRQGKISEEALYAITGIVPEVLSEVVSSDASLPPGMTSEKQLPSIDEVRRLSMLAGQLAYGFEIDDDERLRGIVESLTTVCKLSIQNIAHLTGVAVDDVQLILTEPNSATLESKYALGMRASYLINAVNQAGR